METKQARPYLGLPFVTPATDMPSRTDAIYGQVRL